MKMSKKSKIVIYILLGLVAIYFLAPFIYMLFSAFKTEGEAIAYPPKLLPAEWHFENFINAWKSQPFGTYLWNSILVTVLTTVGQVLSCSLVAYGFARFNFKGKNILFMILLSTMMIPWDVTMIPQYMEFNLFGWINTLKPLIVPAWFGSAYYVFLMRQFLMGIPKDFEEAARIDGLSEVRIFFQMFIPTMKSTYAAAAVITFMNAWNAYLWPKVIMTDNKAITMPMLIANLITGYVTDYGMLMCGVLFCSIPTMVVFFVLQKQFAEGITGAVK